MPVKLGNTGISGMNLGSTAISRAYIGTTEVFSSETAPSFDRPIQITNIGNAFQTTSQSVFGGASYQGSTNRWLEAQMLPPSGDFTVEHWTRINNRSTQSGNWEFENGNHFIRVQNRQSGLSFGRNNGLIITDTSGNTILEYWTPEQSFPDNNWFHVAVTRAGNTFRFYLNGTLRHTQTLSNFSMPDTTTFRIGAGPTTRHIRGFMDEIRVSSVARYTGSSFTVPNSQFTNDSNTLLLVHMNGPDGSTVFVDDNS